jgi:transcriptional regulator of heat shock response
LEKKNEALQQQHNELDEKTKALQQIIHKVYHEGPLPISGRINGLAQISFPSLKKLDELLTLLERPHHHRYASLARKEFHILEEYFLKSKAEAEAMFNYLKNSVKKFERLQ